MSGDGKAPDNGIGLQVDIKDDSLVICLPLSALQTAAECWSDFQKWDLEKREYKKPRVTDVQVFAKEVLHELLSEGEDGSTLVTRLFDRAFRDAVEDGAEGIVVPDDDWYDGDCTPKSEGELSEPRLDQ